MPGAVSPATGLIKNANSVWLNGRPFVRDIERALNRIVRVAKSVGIGANRQIQLAFRLNF